MSPATRYTCTVMVLMLCSLAATAQDGCPGEATAIIEHWIIEYPVLLETTVGRDAVITLPNGPTISVTGAPTSLSTIVTAFSTSTKTIEINVEGSEADTFPTKTNELDSLTVATTASGSPGSPSTLPSTTAKTPWFNLYTRSDIPRLSGLLIGESLSGDVVVGEVDVGPLFSINEAHQLIDADGNFIFFAQALAPQAPVRRASNKRDILVRQAVDIPVLEYGPLIPSGTVDANFTLEGTVIRIQDSDSTYAPFICTSDPVQQSIYIAKAQTIPSDCFNVSLVTVPVAGFPSHTSSGTEPGLPPASTSTQLSSAKESSTTSNLSMTSSASSTGEQNTTIMTSLSTSTVPTTASSSLHVPTTSDDLLGSATDIIETSSLQPWCSTILGYTTQTTTVTSVTTSVDVSTTTVISGTTIIYRTVTTTQTTTVPEATTTITTTPTVTVTTTSTGVPPHTAGIAPANGTPPPLAEFPPDIVTSACSLEATPVTATVTETIEQTTHVTSFASTTIPATMNQTVTSHTTVTESIGTITNTVTGLATTTTTTITVAPTGVILIDRSGQVFVASGSNHYMLAVNNPADVETFTVTEEGQLYSIAREAFYYEGTAPNGNVVFFWDTNPDSSASNFYTNTLTDGSGLQEILFTDQSTGSVGRWCVESDPEGSTQNVIGDCSPGIASGVQVRLYLSSE